MFASEREAHIGTGCYDVVFGCKLVEVLERLNGARGFLYLIKNEQSMLVDADA